MFLARQLEFALFDFTLHLAEQPADPLTDWPGTRRDIALFELPDYHRMPLSVSHIFAGNYAAGYCEEVLARGGSRPTLESFIHRLPRPRTRDRGAAAVVWVGGLRRS